MNPFLALGVPENADDQTIRRAYLAAVKEFPPDVAPKRFQAFSQAYEKIKDQASRNRHLLFNKECPADSPLQVLALYGEYCQFKPLSFGAMKKLLASTANSGSKG